MDKIAFLIPSTSNNRYWSKHDQTYLFKSLDMLNKHYPGIHIYISYDSDDKLYSTEMEKIISHYKKLKCKLIVNDDIDKGDVVQHWNVMLKEAYHDNIEYFYLIGDDIEYPDNNEWLPNMINKLKENNNIGFSAGDSGNPNLPMTQFIIHKRHYEIFGFAFNPMIKNWFCDNYMNELYPKRYINYFEGIKLLNTGGEPRYQPIDHSKLYKALVRRDRPKLKPYI
tara:strand:+ start:3087 stop:3758 length:672 start_codon:yes stop_codon:yes gene_type:complete